MSSDRALKDLRSDGTTGGEERRVEIEGRRLVAEVGGIVGGAEGGVEGGAEGGAEGRGEGRAEGGEAIEGRRLVAEVGGIAGGAEGVAVGRGGEAAVEEDQPGRSDGRQAVPPPDAFEVRQSIKAKINSSGKKNAFTKKAKVMKAKANVKIAQGSSRRSNTGGAAISRGEGARSSGSRTEEDAIETPRWSVRWHVEDPFDDEKYPENRTPIDLSIDEGGEEGQVDNIPSTSEASSDVVARRASKRRLDGDERTEEPSEKKRRLVAPRRRTDLDRIRSIHEASIPRPFWPDPPLILRPARTPIQDVEMGNEGSDRSGETTMEVDGSSQSDRSGEAPMEVDASNGSDRSGENVVEGQQMEVDEDSHNTPPDIHMTSLSDPDNSSRMEVDVAGVVEESEERMEVDDPRKKKPEEVLVNDAKRAKHGDDESDDSNVGTSTSKPTQNPSINAAPEVPVDTSMNTAFIEGDLDDDVEEGPGVATSDIPANREVMVQIQTIDDLIPPVDHMVHYDVHEDGNMSDASGESDDSLNSAFVEENVNDSDYGEVQEVNEVELNQAIIEDAESESDATDESDNSLNSAFVEENVNDSDGGVLEESNEVEFHEAVIEDEDSDDDFLMLRRRQRREHPVEIPLVDFSPEHLSNSIRRNLATMITDRDINSMGQNAANRRLSPNAMFAAMMSEATVANRDEKNVGVLHPTVFDGWQFGRKLRKSDIDRQLYFKSPKRILIPLLHRVALDGSRTESHWAVGAFNVEKGDCIIYDSQVPEKKIKDQRISIVKDIFSVWMGVQESRRIRIRYAFKSNCNQQVPGRDHLDDDGIFVAYHSRRWIGGDLNVSNRARRDGLNVAGERTRLLEVFSSLQQRLEGYNFHRQATIVPQLPVLPAPINQRCHPMLRRDHSVTMENMTRCLVALKRRH